MLKFMCKTAVAGALIMVPATGFAQREKISNDMSKCAANAAGPAVHVQVSGFKEAKGRIRVQAYPSVQGKWLEKGAWINRIDASVAPKGGTMDFCVPLPKAGSYGIAVRHDVNGDGSSSWSDGGGFSGNPKISLLNLKPSASKTALAVGNGVTRISVVLNYRQGTLIKPIG